MHAVIYNTDNWERQDRDKAAGYRARLQERKGSGKVNKNNEPLTKKPRTEERKRGKKKGEKREQENLNKDYILSVSIKEVLRIKHTFDVQISLRRNGRDNVFDLNEWSGGRLSLFGASGKRRWIAVFR